VFKTILIFRKSSASLGHLLVFGCGKKFPSNGKGSSHRIKNSYILKNCLGVKILNKIQNRKILKNLEMETN